MSLYSIAVILSKSNSAVGKKCFFLPFSTVFFHCGKSCRLFCVYRGVSRRLAVRMGKRFACNMLFAVFGDDGFPFKAKIRTILVNFPKGFLWYGISICFGMHDLTICIYHQLVMTYFLSLFGKDFWSKKLRSVFREWGKIENSLISHRVQTMYKEK